MLFFISQKMGLAVWGVNNPLGLVFSTAADSFEVSLGDELIFSKLETKQFPDAEQVCRLKLFLGLPFSVQSFNMYF